MYSEKEFILIKDSSGKEKKVELITFLISEDNYRNYVVYYDNEKQGVDEERVIYISRFIEDNGLLIIQEIKEDVEWQEILKLLKKITNGGDR